MISRGGGEQDTGQDIRKRGSVGEEENRIQDRILGRGEEWGGGEQETGQHIRNWRGVGRRRTGYRTGY